MNPPAGGTTWVAHFTDSRLYACLAILLGLSDAALLIGSRQINPTNLAWLNGDPAVYQAGWEFLRHSRWSISPVWISRLDYPFGISAAYLDVIPILAVPLRIISRILPTDFQYLGMYATLCLILQTYFGLRLLSRFTSDKIFIFIGALFFLDAPILVSRLIGHFSLCSQWLITAALYYYFAPIRARGLDRYILPFAVLLAVAGGMTPYLSAMVFVIGVAALFRWYIMRCAECSAEVSGTLPEDSGSDHPVGGPRVFAIPAVRGLLWFSVLLLVMLSAFLFFGFLTFGASAQIGGDGYPDFSMNLLGPINPAGSALYFRQFDVFPSQGFEGYNYLGMGIILLGIICLARRPKLLTRIWGPSPIAVTVGAVLLALLALSVKVTFGQSTLYVIPVPRYVLHGLAVFRSSGRFFWLAHYLIVLGAITATLAAFSTRTARCAILGVALLIQYFDILPVRDAVADRFAARYVNPLRAAVWPTVGRNHKHLILLPARQCDLTETPGGDANWSYFALLAARSGMTLNSTHAARDSAQSDSYNCNWLPQHLLHGELADDTAYVLSDQLALSAIEHDSTHYCRRVDGFNLCTFDPAEAHLSGLLGLVILPPLVLGTEFRADKAVPRDLLMEGWDLGQYSAIWTVGPRASIYFRPILPNTEDLLLEFRFGGHGALLTVRHPLQRAMISVNGERIGTLRFTYGGDNAERAIVIPRKLLAAGRIAEIRIDLPDAVAPHDIGINSDGRLLGLYVSQFRIVSAPGS
jgi:hypothetical protein